MTRAELASVLACAMVATPACSRDTGPADSASAFVVTDSSGGRIVRNQGPGALGDSLLPRREDLRIGVVEGAYEFELHGVRDLAVGPAGEIYAALQTLGEIRVFDAGGRYLRTLGGEGEGPGEFRALTWIGVFGDTVLGYDARLSRMTLFWNDGAVLDTWQLSAGGVGARILPRARSEHGWIATLDDIRARVPYGIGQPGTDTTRIAVLASIPEALAMLPTGAPPWTVLDVVVQYPSWTNWGVGTPDFVYGRNPLWEAREHYAIDGAGRIYLSRGSRYAIDVYDATGSLLRRVTRTHEPVPITGALIDRYRATAVAYYDSTSRVGEGGVDLVDALDQHLEVPRLDHLPVLGNLVVSANGAIWVERPDLVDDPLLLEWSRAGSHPERWDVFDPDGRYLGTVEIPERATLHVVGTDWMLVTERDDLDVQYIVRYEIGG